MFCSRVALWSGILWCGLLLGTRAKADGAYPGSDVARVVVLNGSGTNGGLRATSWASGEFLECARGQSVLLYCAAGSWTWEDAKGGSCAFEVVGGHEYWVGVRESGDVVAYPVPSTDAFNTGYFWTGVSFVMCLGLTALGARWVKSLVVGGSGNQLNE